MTLLLWVLSFCIYVTIGLSPARADSSALPSYRTAVEVLGTHRGVGALVIHKDELYVLTASHVLKHRDPLVLIYSAHKADSAVKSDHIRHTSINELALNAQIVWDSPFLDAALVRIKNLEPEQEKALRKSAHVLRRPPAFLPDKIYSYRTLTFDPQIPETHPGRTLQAISWKKESNYYDFLRGHERSLRHNFLRGMSGSPIFRDSELVGILSQVSLNLSHYSKMVSVSDILDELENPPKNLKAFWVNGALRIETPEHTLRAEASCQQTVMAGGELSNGGGELSNGGGELSNGGGELSNGSSHDSVLAPNNSSAKDSFFSMGGGGTFNDPYQLCPIRYYWNNELVLAVQQSSKSAHLIAPDLHEIYSRINDRPDTMLLKSGFNRFAFNFMGVASAPILPNKGILNTTVYRYLPESKIWSRLSHTEVLEVDLPMMGFSVAVSSKIDPPKIKYQIGIHPPKSYSTVMFYQNSETLWLGIYLNPDDLSKIRRVIYRNGDLLYVYEE